LEGERPGGKGLVGISILSIERICCETARGDGGVEVGRKLVLKEAIIRRNQKNKAALCKSITKRFMEGEACEHFVPLGG